ncbi:MAG: hypothetical protein K9W44_09460 [Candidatus Lokiarchaeota archaeon]|nr:hypothetical protein [Candidatus Harpocratesius repetitus]
MKRLHSLDILRGFMMAYIIILHALIQRVFVSDPAAFATTIDKLPVLLVLAISPFILISLWGSVFSFITGIATAYQMGGIMRDSPNDLVKQNRFLKNRFATSIMIYIVYVLNNIFFSTRSIEHGFPTQSLFTGSLENLSIKAPTFFSLTATSTLETIALTGIIITLVLRSSLKKHHRNPAQVIKRLSTIALFIFAISVILRNIIGDPLPIQHQLIENDQYFLYFIFMRIYPSRFALFPVLGFGFMGASLGLLLSQKVSYKEYAKYAFGYAGLFLGIFGLYLLNGFKIIPHFAEEMTPMPLQFMNMGLQIITISVLVWIFDYSKGRKQQKRLKRVKFLKIFSNSSLSIFVFEPLVASGLYLGYLSVFGDFSNNFAIVVSFMINLGFIWYFLLRLWRYVNNKGSCEWIVVNGKKWLVKLPIFNEFSILSKPNKNQPKIENQQILKIYMTPYNEIQAINRH